MYTTWSSCVCHLQEGRQPDAGIGASAALAHAALTCMFCKALLKALQRAVICLILLHVACRQISTISCKGYGMMCYILTGIFLKTLRAPSHT